MANTLLTISMITNEALAVIENELTFTKFINRQYDDSFGNKGAQIGTTLNIRKPPQYIGRDGQALSLEDSVESSVPLTLSQQSGVDIYFTSTDLALNISDFSERFIRPAVANVANKIDRYMLNLATLATYNRATSSGAGVAPTGQIVLNAGAGLDEAGTPRSSNLRSIVWGPRAQASMVGSLMGLFNAPNAISEQYNTGTMGKALGFKHSMDQNVIKTTTGPQGGAPVVNGANQTGNQLVTNGWTAAAALRLNQGDQFTVAGVYAVNPQSRQSTGVLQTFVVTANVNSDAGGNATIPISPSIVTAGAFQNVTGSPAANAAITLLDAAGALVSNNLAFHRDAFTLACADLPLPNGVDMAARKADPQTGLSVRLVRAYDINTDKWPCRLDILYGGAALYPQWACRIAS